MSFPNESPFHAQAERGLVVRSDRFRPGEEIDLDFADANASTASGEARNGTIAAGIAIAAQLSA